jgi:hypothetical protein
VALWADGEVCGVGAVPPDREGLARFAEQLFGFAGEVVCVIESMTGARFIHDELERHGVEVQIGDARKAASSPVAPESPARRSVRLPTSG